jgi:hypothetical protein
MSVEVRDGWGTSNKLKINGEGEIAVTIHSHPPDDEAVTSFPFRQYFTDNGNSDGSNDMSAASGTVAAPATFYVSAKNKDVFIKSLSMRIGDTGTVNLLRFGGLAALTNGCELEFSNDDIGNVTIADSLTTNLSLVRLGTATAAIGTGVDAFLADAAGGGSEDTYLPFIDFTQTFGFPWGLRLKKESNDRITFKIQDDLTGLITFDIIAYGIQV